MKCIRVFYIELVFIFSCVNGKAADCEALDVKVYVDDAVTSDRQKEQISQLLSSVASSIPEGSSFDLNLIGSDIEKLASFSIPSDNNDWLDQLKETLSNVRPDENHVISFSKAIDRDLLSFYGVNQYKSKAELVIILVESSTKFDTRHSLIWKKKTVVVILGNGASLDQEKVASHEDHVFVVPELADVENVTESLSKTICKDSKLHCDTDRYSLRRGSKCKNCSENVCSDDIATANTSNTCKTRCPYYKTTREEIKVEPETNYETFVKIQDHKYTTIAAILAVISIILITGVIALVIVIRRNRERIGEGEDTPLQNNQDGAINDRVIDNLPDSVAHQETGEVPATQRMQVQTDEEVGEASGTQHEYEPTDAEVAAASMKNERERAMNETALEPPVYDIHGSADLHPL
ncbi:uncharacterized protein LOC128551248 [Mercenaria mercenaria]|uniref:uncharacterized protein LOC128551248 n=1 Tax=Mercenaria mercenaria TaxID=6596 RepID=UPI00234EE494|nr:uncharacterized protein LOC128551248 [Mercenaria mercenaria]